MIWWYVSIYVFCAISMFSAFAVRFGHDDPAMRPAKICFFAIFWPYTITTLIFLRCLEAK